MTTTNDFPYCFLFLSLSIAVSLSSCYLLAALLLTSFSSFLRSSRLCAFFALFILRPVPSAPPSPLPLRRPSSCSLCVYFALCCLGFYSRYIPSCMKPNQS
ncbi:hypothetical protein BD309DRAFT_659158 [Dichomitus squalens]|nr:hypothetical protein BD309DRAFT_659158 [Dichomitus squalens]